MSLQERKGLLSIITSIVVIGVYGVVFYNNYQNWGFNPDNIFRFWAIFFIILVGVSIVARIIGEILFAILNAIINEVRGEEQDDEQIIDERDKLIVLKASRNSMFIFIIGFMIAFVSQLFNANDHLFFILLFVFGFLSDIASNVLTIVYYRKGV